jgi:hypothetical protein
MSPSTLSPPTLLAVVLGAALAVSACSNGDSGGEGTSGGSGSTPNACAEDTRKDVYTAGLSKKTAGALSVKIMEATPAPPAKLTNAMTFQLLDAGGLPVDGATLSVVPFMPDHGHGSAVKPTVTAKGGGVYAVANLYYPMPGLWRVTVTVQLPNAAPQDVAFSFCIDG